MIKEYKKQANYPSSSVYIHIGSDVLNNDFDIHTHNFSELVIITSGTGQHVVNNLSYHVGAGEVFVLCEKSVHGFSQCKNLAMTNIAYDASALERHHDDLMRIAGYHSLFILEPISLQKGEFNQHIKLSCSKQQEIKTYLERLQSVQLSKGLGQATLSFSIFLEIVVALSVYNTHSPHNVQSKNRILSDILAYIQDHYTQKISLDDIQVHCNVSTRHINRLFNQQLGTTPTQYILLLRLTLAYNYLTKTTLSITDIAYDCGFFDSSYLIKCFKKQYGMTPSQVRTK